MSAASLAILAASSPFDVANSYMTRPWDQRSLWPVLFLLLIIGVIWALIALWDQLVGSSSSTPDYSGSLFGELCRIHQLSQAETQGLKRLAKAANLKEPSELFVLPLVWSQVPLPDPTLASLYSRLFGNELSNRYPLPDLPVGN